VLRAGIAIALVGATCALAGGGAAQAHPPAPIDSRGKAVHGKFHRWLHRSQAPLFRGRLQIVRRACPRFPQFVGCVLGSRPRRVYVRPGAPRVRAVFYHEVGHVFDLVVLNRAERRAFKRIMGIRKGGWYGGSPGPAEFFADGYAACSFHKRLRQTLARTAYGYRASPRRHARVCALIGRAAAPRGRRPQPPPTRPPVIDQKPPPAPPKPPPNSTNPAPEPCGLLDRLLGGC
jgi:hypothetical protein